MPPPSAFDSDTLITRVSFRRSHLGIHLVGLADGEGRVSTPIKKYDSNSQIAITSSGRRYKIGDEGMHMDAEHVWTTYAHVNKITNFSWASKAELPC